MPDQQNQDEKSLSQELRDLIIEQGRRLLHWLKPEPKDPMWLKLLKLLGKIPVFLIMLLLSPIALVVLIFTFIAVI